MDEIHIKATPKFIKLASKLMTEEALQELVDYLVLHPNTGNRIQGTGGVRKTRWNTGKGGGKRGGIRVLYYYEENFIILFLMVYKKSDKEDISMSEKKILKKKLAELLKMYRKELC